jgi:hypothetical protein
VRRTSRLALISVTTLTVAGLTLSLTSPANAALGASSVKKVMAKAESVVPTENRLPVVGGTPAGLPLSYGGGPVEVTSKNYAIFWDPASFSYNPNYPTLVQRFLTDLGGSSIYNTLTEYYGTVNGVKTPIKNVATFGGAYFDTSPFPAGGVTDADLQAEVKKIVTANGLPTGIGNEYLVYTGQGGETVASYCAYHGVTTVNGVTTPYADELYGGQSGCTTPSSPNGNPAADSIINTSSHEIWETITDPNVGDGWVAADGDEGSDQCNFLFGTTDASGADIHINGHPYIVQEEWRNSKQPFGCVMS